MAADPTIWTVIVHVKHLVAGEWEEDPRLLITACGLVFLPTLGTYSEAVHEPATSSCEICWEA